MSAKEVIEQLFPVLKGIDPQDYVIIHHLSDIDFAENDGNPHPIFAYGKYLSEHRPELVIITGNVSRTGTPKELSQIAIALRGLLSPFQGDDFKQHVMVVPGPNDITWNRNGSPSFTPFFEAFKDYGVPAHGSALATDVVQSKYVVHLLNTCFEMELIPNTLKKTLKQLQTDIKHLQHAHIFAAWKAWRKKASKIEAVYGDLRKQYLELLEGVYLTYGTGALKRSDVEQFQQRMLARTEDTPEPLKILVTRHPLAPQVSKYSTDLRSDANMIDLLRIARQQRFTLGLYGHVALPHAHAEFAQEQPLLRQLGAGRLGADSTFSIIAAIRNQAKDGWLFQGLPISLDAANQRYTTPFILLNPANAKASGIQATSKVDEMLQRRQDFDAQLRQALLQLSESVGTSEALIPQRPLTTIREAIKHILFRGLDTRVGLALKYEINGNIYLKNTYLEPETKNRQHYIHPYHYSTTAASWALILGRELVFSDSHAADAAKQFSFEDNQWLIRSQKLYIVREELDKQLKRLETEHQRLQAASGEHYPDEAKVLEDSIERVKGLIQKLQTNTLSQQDVFQQQVNKEEAPIYSSFVAMPIPLRPQDDTEPARRDEIGVLHIDVKRPAKPDEEYVLADEDFFSEERIDLLRSVSDVMYVILSTSDRLESPKGSWRF